MTRLNRMIGVVAVALLCVVAVLGTITAVPPGTPNPAPYGSMYQKVIDTVTFIDSSGVAQTLQTNMEVIFSAQKEATTPNYDTTFSLNLTVSSNGTANPTPVNIYSQKSSITRILTPSQIQLFSVGENYGQNVFIDNTSDDVFQAGRAQYHDIIASMAANIVHAGLQSSTQCLLYQ